MRQVTAPLAAPSPIGEFPKLPVILMSAYAPRALTRVGIYQSVVPVLVKPFTEDELAGLIQIALDDRDDWLQPNPQRQSKTQQASIDE